jgi:hypothetical protein
MINRPYLIDLSLFARESYDPTKPRIIRDPDEKYFNVRAIDLLEPQKHPAFMRAWSYEFALDPTNKTARRLVVLATTAGFVDVAPVPYKVYDRHTMRYALILDLMRRWRTDIDPMRIHAVECALTPSGSCVEGIEIDDGLRLMFDRRNHDFSMAYLVAMERHELREAENADRDYARQCAD